MSQLAQDVRFLKFVRCHDTVGLAVSFIEIHQLADKLLFRRSLDSKVDNGLSTTAQAAIGDRVFISEFLLDVSLMEHTPPLLRWD